MNWSKSRAFLRSQQPGKTLLGAASLAYGAGVLGRRMLYDFNILKRQKVDAKVICIGNLTTGGTGKTPAVLLTTRALRQRGHKVAVLSRGYGSAPKKDALVLLDGRPCDWHLCGDEPWMIHQSLQGQDVPVVVCPDRVRAGELAVSRYGSRILILDDGFQHLQLHRDLNVVLINARSPLNKERLLPLGDLREPISALRRAQIVILTHADRATAKALSKLRETVEAVHPGIPVLESAHKAEDLFDVRTETRRPLSHLEGQAVVGLSAIGDPLSFEGQIEALGAKLAQGWRYPDHHVYTESELRSLENLRGHLPLVTTHKDFVRFPENWREILTGEVLVLRVNLELIKGREIWERALDEIGRQATP